MSQPQTLRYPFDRQYVFVGTTANGHRVLVSGALYLQPQTRMGQTTEHTEINDPETLSLISAVFKGKKNIDRNSEGGGAKAPELRLIVKAAPGFTIAEAHELYRIGKTWHLNTMHAECAHMTLPEDASYKVRKGITCPQTGYEYGAQWLTEPLPDDIRARFIELMSQGETESVDY